MYIETLENGVVRSTLLKATLMTMEKCFGSKRV
jgi:hypothetical protein